MVLIGDQKHACQTCIKGHRSSNCNHADRPLFPIKRKGRPTTQCDHCRELRKTRRVHVKCMCGSKNPINNGNTGLVPSTITISHSNPTPPLTDGSSSDSDHNGCSCASTQDCHCWTPRVSASASTKHRRSRSSAHQADTLITPSSTPPLSWSERERLQPSSVRHERIHNAGSPYGPAYAAHHQPHSRPIFDPTHLMSGGDTALYDPNLILSPDFQISPLCSCPAGCGCLGCTNLQSNPVGIVSQCNDHGACHNCFDCSVLSIPLPSQYGLYSGQDLDLWMGQAAAQSTEPLPLPDLFIADLNIPTATPLEHLPSDFEGIWTAPDLGVYPTISSIPPFS